jgi:DNA polymerase elongation subunit (family B)
LERRDVGRLQIATAVNVTNSHDEPDYYCRIFVVGSSGEVNGADKCEAGTEREMLIALSSFLQDEVDPDIVVTFESSTADMITSRMSLLGLPPDSILGRVRCVDSRADQGCKASCANIPGRLRWAVQDLVKSEYCQLRSYDFEALMGLMCKENVILLAEEERSRMSNSTEQDRASLSLILCTQAAGLLCIMKQLDAVENAVMSPEISILSSSSRSRMLTSESPTIRCRWRM